MKTVVKVIVPAPQPVPRGALLLGMLVDVYLRLTRSSSSGHPARTIAPSH